MQFYIFIGSIFIVIFLIYIFYNLYLYLSTDFLYKIYKKRKAPKKYEDVLLKYFPFYKVLPPHLKKRLIACIAVFIKNKEFLGVKGIKVDSTKKIIIAANACLLSIGKDRCMYKHVKTVIIYPDIFLIDEKIDNGAVIKEEKKAALGLASNIGVVVISWPELLKGDLNIKDGKNVGIHEFAHQLDLTDGLPDGTPEMDYKLYKEWTDIFSKEFKKLKNLYIKHHKSFLDGYAFENEAEFFAVISEYFFEKPKLLYKKEPLIYEELKKFYRLDPKSWAQS